MNHSVERDGQRAMRQKGKKKSRIAIRVRWKRPVRKEKNLYYSAAQNSSILSYFYFHSRGILTR